MGVISKGGIRGGGGGGKKRPGRACQHCDLSSLFKTSKIDLKHAVKRVQTLC